VAQQVDTHTPRRPAQLLVVDDHPIVRLGIRQMVSADSTLTITQECESAEDALQKLRDAAIDLAIVDLSLKGGGGLQLIRSMRELAPEVLVLVLSMHDEALFAERSLKAGAHGYIMKQEAVVSLVRAIRQVLSGRIFLSERMSQRLFHRIGHGEPSRGGLDLLTDRELEVFEMIGRGLSTAVIADRLNVSVKTVETYRSNIKSKLDLKDALELLRYATSWTDRL
jgi:DNA-binding NarL/FixJ family response regulator